VWRSWLARAHGVREVAGSSPATPTMKLKTIYESALKLARTQKILWFYGLISAFFSFSFGLSNNFRLNLPSQVPSELNLPQLPDFYLQFKPVFDRTLELISRVPTSTWLLLASSLFITSTLFMILRLFISQWALGSLIAGISLSLSKKPLTIRSCSHLGLKAVLRLIILQILPWFIYWFIPGLFAFLAIPIFTNAPVLIKTFVGIFLALVAIIYFSVGLILVWLSLNLARRVVVFQPLSFSAAWQKAWRLSQKHWRPLLTLGLANLAIKLILVTALAALLAVLVSFGYHLYRFAGLKLVLGFAPVLILFFSLVGLFFSGLLKVFFESSWTIIYRKLK
jgi:hypothetical protein